MSGIIALGDNKADIWYTFQEEVVDAERLEEYHALLSDDERAQYDRFVFDKDRHTFLVSRALVRTVLSMYSEVRPGDWRFRRNKYGRPEIAFPSLPKRLRFSLSHTSGMIVCLCACDRDVGVDVEDMEERRGRTLDLVDRYFSPYEVRSLHALPSESRRRRFFEYWTLKESYIKARGMGLSLPLDQFSLHLEEGEAIRISFDPRMEDDPCAWQFALFRLTERHMVAAAVRRGDGPDLKIRVKPTIPSWATI